MTVGADEARRPTPLAACPHLVSGIAALVIFVAATSGVLLIARSNVRDRAEALASLMIAEKWNGKAAPLAILERADLVPLYGSSELVVDMPNRATELFVSYPTGFAIAPIGDRGYPVLAMTLSVGSLGPAIRGKPVVISLSGTWFVGDDTVNDAAIFRNHYSELQAGDLLFSSGLPIGLRRRLAARIREYDLVTRDFPLLNSAFACLASSCPLEGALPAFAPIWAARSFLLRTKDYIMVARRLRTAAVPARHPATIDWQVLEASADSVWRERSASNRYGIADSLWKVKSNNPYAAITQGNTSDSGFVGDVARATRWRDLDLLLATLDALGARALILNTPLKGVWWDYRGVSPAARQWFYRRFETATTAYGFVTKDFAERDGDPYFLSEPRSHLSPKGWAVYDRTIDAFYHDLHR